MKGRTSRRILAAYVKKKKTRNRLLSGLLSAAMLISMAVPIAATLDGALDAHAGEAVNCAHVHNGDCKAVPMVIYARSRRAVRLHTPP